MDAVIRVVGRAYPLGLANVDTDAIIPAHWMKKASRRGLGAGAFETLRAAPGNPIDDPRYSGAPMLVAGANFGCGSSREHAVWALADLGIRAVIAPSFSDIFAGNAAKNGIVPAEVTADAFACLLQAARTGSLALDLETCQIRTAAGEKFEFDLEPFRRRLLLDGLDEIELTLEAAAAISRFEAALEADQPWT